MSDKIAAALQGIRDRAAHAEDAQEAWSVLSGDVPRLLAAVDAVLKLADMLPPQGPPASALEEDRMWIRSECADMIREAISRALLGEESTNG